MKKKYSKSERREFLRLDFIEPIAYKVCEKKVVSKLLKGYTSNISQSGVLCNINQRVSKNDVLWLSFDRYTLSTCEDIEKRCFIYQSGIFGKVVRVEAKKGGTYNIGIRFITREEKDRSNIYPEVYFMKGKQKKQDEDLLEQDEDLPKEESTESFDNHDSSEQEENIDQQKWPERETGEAEDEEI
jgi:c-di-GMP-binding flagellar brake protein YcgR